MDENNKYRLGLALSGGGAKGFAHIGVLRLLEEFDLIPDIISGTSAGAIAGALFADGYSSGKIEEIFTGREFSEFARLHIPKDGLFDSDRFRKFLKYHLRAKKFEDLKIPLVVVATDLDNGCSHEFRSGPIVDAVVASCSIPVIFSPVEINGIHYVDGGLFRNFPVSTIRNECKQVIGMNVSPLIPQKYKQTIVGVAERSYHYLFRANTVDDRLMCDLLIETEDAGAYKAFDLENVSAIADLGYEAAVNAFNKAINERRLSIAGGPSPQLFNDRLQIKKEMKKMIIYQTFPRLFGNMNDSPVKNGSMMENGVGKFSAYTPAVLRSIKKMGITHVWYTGIIEHATQTDYSRLGIHKDHPSIVKGKAGSPYAIKDYYDTDPDLADNPRLRMEEFEDLLKRTQDAGMKVIIDFVANHVARQYKSDVRFAYVDDLGQRDNKSLAFSPDNNFYYIPSHPLTLNFESPNEGFEYSEFPAKATGNDLFSPSPGDKDWYETVKLNYGVDYMHGGRTHFQPIPGTWKKMLDILRFWADKGVDGFRCDMAEMVPVEFWGWVIPILKKEYPVVFIAEIYNPDKYRDYLNTGHFDFLYDKVGLYDTLRAVMCRKAPAKNITEAWQTVDGIQAQMLSFLENHDEQRIASDFFAGNPWAGVAGMIVAALINTNPVMIYNGQEFGERGMDEEGFSGCDGRTSIFDYWSMGSIRKWLKGDLSDDEQNLYSFYSRLLNIATTEAAIMQGSFYDIMYANRNNSRFDANSQYAFLRKQGKDLILVAVNFDNAEKTVEVSIPCDAFQTLGIKDNGAARMTDLFTGETAIATLTAACPFSIILPPLSGRVIKFTYL